MNLNLTINSTLLNSFSKLIRWDKPIGTLLLLWPTLTALWLASNGQPHALILFVFICGVFLMRAAGCIINDIADRKIDRQIIRTKDRPLTTNEISIKSAFIFLFILLLIAFLLVLQLNRFTIIMAFIGLITTAIYPFLKRFTNLPQLGLGIAFNWGILMAFTAEQNFIPLVGFVFYLSGLLITIAYDTMYAMVDREDDLKARIKSTAILFAENDRLIIASLQTTAFFLLLIVGLLLKLNAWYYAGLTAWIVLIIYQHFLIKDRKPELCFKAFLNNHWSWFMIFFGVVLALM